MSEYNFISNEFKRDGHYWRATDESCKCGEEFVILRRTGFESELEELATNTAMKTKICIPKVEVRDKLI